MTQSAYFTSATFTFLEQLAENNDREWFALNKSRYEEEVRDPALRLIADFGSRLRDISPHFLAVPKAQGGSLFRIYRDTRFSKDKSPFKNNTGIHFRHESSKDAHAPGFYLHIQPGEVFFGAGLWRPEGSAAKAIRELIASKPDDWIAAVTRPPFTDELSLAGESLKRPPRGFDPEHPLIEDLKRKDFIGSVDLGEKTAKSGDLLDRMTVLCSAAAPLMAFLCRAVGVPF